MRVTGRFVDREADDLSLGVDAARQNQREVRVRGDQVVEGAHLAVLPNEGAQVEVRVQRHTDDLGAVVDIQACTHEVSRKRAQILHAFFLGPEEGVIGGVASEIGIANDLAFVIHVQSDVSGKMAGTAQVSKVAGFGFAGLPKQGVQWLEI